MGSFSEWEKFNRNLRRVAVEMSPDPLSTDGFLYQGILRYHSDPNETSPFKAMTVGRSACEAVFLFTQDSWFYGGINDAFCPMV